MLYSVLFRPWVGSSLGLSSTEGLSITDTSALISLGLTGHSKFRLSCALFSSTLTASEPIISLFLPSGPAFHFQRHYSSWLYIFIREHVNFTFLRNIRFRTLFVASRGCSWLSQEAVTWQSPYMLAFSNPAVLSAYFLEFWRMRDGVSGCGSIASRSFSRRRPKNSSFFSTSALIDVKGGELGISPWHAEEFVHFPSSNASASTTSGVD